MIQMIQVYLRAFLGRFIHDERGLTTVEYAIAGGLVGLAVVVAFDQLGTTVGGVIEDIDDCLSTGNC